MFENRGIFIRLNENQEENSYLHQDFGGMEQDFQHFANLSFANGSRLITRKKLGNFFCKLRMSIDMETLILD